MHREMMLSGAKRKGERESVVALGEAIHDEWREAELQQGCDVIAVVVTTNEVKTLAAAVMLSFLKL